MKKPIIISPYSRTLRNGKRNPKDYPFWPEVIAELVKLNYRVVQIGLPGEPQLPGVSECRFSLSLKQLKELLINDCATYISVDSFFPHLGYLVEKPGIVIFAQSDPNIFGHPTNINLLKDRKYLRTTQFDLWESCEYIEDAFVSSDVVVAAVVSQLSK